jgi:hypothetical protein
MNAQDLGDRVEMAAALLETATTGARRRPVTAAEFVAGRIAPSIDTTAASKLLADVDTVVTADEYKQHLRRDGQLVALKTLADELREAIAAAAPFTIQKEKANE